jgi:diguanylate cyclase (GGDEF)-like protein
MKILIIDDEADVLQFLGSFLSMEGYEVISASDGMEGIEKFFQEHPDLVITDMKMPNKDGLEVLKEIRASQSDVDVIILSGHGDDLTAADCLRQGAYDYLMKPLEDIDLLLFAMDRALKKREANQKNQQLMEKIDEIAIIDVFTGVYTRRYLNRRLDEEVERSKRSGHDLSIALIDLDGDRPDAVGESGADDVDMLRRLSDILLRSYRSTDSLYRYSGNALIVMMPETSFKGALTAFKRILEVLRSELFKDNAGVSEVPINVGFAQYPWHASDTRGLIRHTQERLCRPKEIIHDSVV